MKVLLSWLKEFLKTDAAVSQIEEFLTLAGLEVEKVEPTEFSFSGVVVGEVLNVSPHPEADKLRIAKVSDGKEEFQVVCGASNCREGMLTAFAKIGANLTDQESGKIWKIKKAKLRGVESLGMLASEVELGLPETVAGIMELPIDTPIGVHLDSLFGDVIFDIFLTPNLGHCMSVFGVARELSSLLPSSKLHFPSKPVHDELGEPIEKKISVHIEEEEQCFAYHCAFIENVQVGPSPKWLVDRLTQCGIRSINNVVDVTNYVMLELGQPLHAFDYDQIEGKKILVRESKTGEKLTTLDHVQRTLPPHTLVIADVKKTLAIAGVMGGEDSSVTENTKDILLESAHFNPKIVRRVSKTLNLRSDSSTRFERGIDSNLPHFALQYATHLILQIAGGKVAKGIVTKKTQEFPQKKILCRLERIHKILGVALSLSEVEEIFQSLQMQVTRRHQSLEVSIPSFRNDVEHEIDLIEEVARVYGYNNIPKNSPKFRLGNQLNHPMFDFQKKIRSYFLQAGLQEFISCNLISPAQSKVIEEAFPHLSSAAVLHPSSVDQSVLRISLLPSLLHSLKVNFDQRNFSISAFELGKIHYQKEQSFQEKDSLGVMLTGRPHPYHFEDPKDLEVDFFTLKGIVENLFLQIRLSDYTIKPFQNPLFHPQRQTEILHQDRRIAVMGEIHPSVGEQFGLNRRIYFAELDVDALLQLTPKDYTMTPLPSFPGSDRDWTITLKSDVPLQAIIDAAKNSSSHLLHDCQILYLYESEKLGKDRKNATFRFYYRSDKKTIDQETVDKEHTRISKQILHDLNTRGFIVFSDSY